VYAYRSELDAWRDARQPGVPAGALHAPEEPADGLEAAQEGERPRGESLPRWVTPWRVAGLVVIGISCIAALLRFSYPWPATHSTRRFPSRGASNLVAVTVFENRTGDASLGPIGRLAADHVISAIARVSTATVNPEAHASARAIGEAPEGGATAIAGQSGAALVVTGAYYLRDEGLEFQTRILAGETGRLLHALDPVSGTLAPSDAAFERLRQKVAGAVAIHFDEFFGGLGVVSHAPTLDAYREYRAGHEIFDRDYPRALAHLERALAIDPDFWMPRMVMVFAYLNLRQEADVQKVQQAMVRQRDRLTPAERLFVDYLTELVNGRYPEAFRALDDLAQLVPRSWGVNFNLGLLALMLNRPRTTIEVYDRLPFDERHVLHRIGIWRLGFLSQALHLVEEYERELDQTKLAQRAEPASLKHLASEVRALAALGRTADITGVIDRSLSITPTSGSPERVMEAAAVELRAHGHRETSLAVAARAVDWLRSRPADTAATQAHREDLANALYLNEQWEEARSLFAALEAEDPARTSFVGPLGTIAARQGDAAEARAVSEKLRNFSQPFLFGSHTYWRSCIAALLGDRQSAVDLLRESFAQGGEYRLGLHNDPDLERLRDYPPFLDFVRPRN
jgi:tetratricopeptide (TPR) repeat protein